MAKLNNNIFIVDYQFIFNFIVIKKNCNLHAYEYIIFRFGSKGDLVLSH